MKLFAPHVISRMACALLGIVLGASGVLVVPHYRQCWNAGKTPPPKDETVSVVTLEPQIVIAVPGSFHNLLRRWRGLGVTEDQLCDVMASEFDFQQAFHDRERQRTRLVPPSAPQGWLPDRWQHKRDDLIIKFVGNNAFHRWNQSRLFSRLQLEKIPLTATETNALYQICYQHGRLMYQHQAETAQDWQSHYNQQTAGLRAYRKALRELLDEPRYYQFLPALRPDKFSWFQENPSNPMTREQKVALYRIDEWELEECEKIRAETVPAPPVVSSVSPDGMSRFVMSTKLIPLPMDGLLSQRDTRLEAISKLAQERRAAIMKSLNPPSSMR